MPKQKRARGPAGAPAPQKTSVLLAVNLTTFLVAAGEGMAFAVSFGVQGAEELTTRLNPQSPAILAAAHALRDAVIGELGLTGFDLGENLAPVANSSKVGRA